MQNYLPVKKILGSHSEIISYSEYGEISARDYQFNNVTKYKEVYTRDKLGRITNKAVTKNAVITNFSFEYDLKGRLKQTKENNVVKSTYTYDAQGNRKTKNDNYTANYDSKDRITDSVNDGVSSSYSYTNDGSQITIARPGYSKNIYVGRLNPLLAVVTQNGSENTSISYQTDAELKRSHKFRNNGIGTMSTYFTYDKNLRLIGEVNPDLGTNARFIYATQSHSPDYMIFSDSEGEDKYFFVKDQLGSILQVVNSAGVALQEIQYDEFGIVLSNSRPAMQPFGFAGGHYDWDTGLVRFGARDYDGEVGRWLERDPSGFGGGDTNLYAYVNNDPINYVDPSGRSAVAIIRAAAAIAAGYCAFRTGYDFTSDFTNNSILANQIEGIEKSIKDKNAQLLGLAQQKDQDSKCSNDQGKLIGEIAGLEQEIISLNLITRIKNKATPSKCELRLLLNRNGIPADPVLLCIP